MTVSVAEKPIEKIISSMLTKHHLVRIEFNVTERIINARAMPQSYHPQVTENLKAALEKAASLTNGSISMQEASQITQDAPKKPVAVAYGHTFQEVLTALGKELKALK